MNYSFHPYSIRAVNYASSWNRTTLTTNSLSTPDRRRSGIVYPSSVFQAVTANSAHHEAYAANIRERSSPVEDATLDGEYSISYWYTLGIFDADPNSITDRFHLSSPRILAPWPLSIIHVRPPSCHVSSCQVISPKSHYATSPHCNVSIQHLSLHQASETSCHRFRSHSHAIPNSRTLA
jgi:hypothetical protein